MSPRHPSVLATRIPGVLALALLFGSSAGNAQASVCPEDIDGSGEVDAGDIALALLSFGPCGGTPCDEDIDGSGEVDAGDIALMLLSFGQCPGPAWATVIEWAPDPSVVYDETLREAIVATHLPWRVVEPFTGIEMLLVPPGQFVMGCSQSQRDQYCDPNGYETPRHQVQLTNPFYLGRHEVTQMEWFGVTHENPSISSWGCRRISTCWDCPIDNVSWYDRTQFLDQTGFRPPTEAEWEYACRGGTDTAYHGWIQNPAGTNDETLVGSIAWCGTNSETQGDDGSGPCSTIMTHPVGGKPSNGFGLHDMLGNVAEPVSDYVYLYTEEPQVNPTSPCGPISITSSCGFIAARGGSSWAFERDLRVSSRYRTGSGWFSRANGFGIRVARDP